MMKKIKYIFASAMLLGVMPLQSASAAIDTRGLTTTSGIINLALLLCVIIGIAWSMKVMSLVRGGLLSKSWQMFALGFVFLMLARLLALGETVKLVAAPEYVTTILYLLMILTWLVGIYQTKKILA